ncbi:13397_t:CDS:10, partial [Gigaspora margarita]
YLQNHFSELDWQTKIKMAKEISSGINYLHNANIVHRDLVSDFYLFMLRDRQFVEHAGLTQYVNTNNNTDISDDYVFIQDLALDALVEEIKKIYKDSECNKDTCFIMLNRVIVAECSMTQMFNQNESYRKFSSTTEIKKKYDKLTEEYNACMKDLNFTMAIDGRRLEVKKVDNSLKSLNETLDFIVQELNILKSRQPDNTYTQKIDPSHLFDPPIGQMRHDEQIDEFKIQLEILRILDQPPYFLKFYGLSNVDCYDVMVLHNLDPKIGNFKYSRTIGAKARNFINLVPNIIRWMAPEQINKYKHQRYNEKVYTFNCEIFGMLIWEFCYEKLPYEDWNIQKITDHVLNPWRHIPPERIGVAELQQVLEQLAATYPISPGVTIFLDNKTLNSDGSLPSLKSESGSSFIPLDRGIGLHKKRDHVNAWKCFKENADLGDVSAKYWQGYYLCHGYGVVEKDERHAIELFKDAADNDHPDAQFRYAVLLLNNLKSEQNITIKNELCGEILHYFKLAANYKNYYAVYHLGNIYLNGKLTMEKNKDLGVEYLKLAAENGHEKAIKLLKELENRMDMDE